MRTVLLVLAMVCFFVAMVLAGHWGWLGIDPNPRLVHVWGYGGGIAFAASFLPWSDWRRRYEG